MSTFSDVKGSASVQFNIQISSCFSKSAFQLHYSTHRSVSSTIFCTFRPKFCTQQAIADSQGFFSPKVSSACGPSGQFTWDQPIERILSFCLFCLICQPSLGTGGGIGWRGKFELREGEEDNLSGEVFFIFSSASLPTHLLLEVRWGSSRGYWLLYCGRLVTGKSGRSHYHQQAPSQVHMALAVPATGLLGQHRTRVLGFD